MTKLVLIATLVFFMTGQMPTTTQTITMDKNDLAENDDVVVVPSALSNAEVDVEALIPEVCSQPEQVVATMANGYVAFVSATPIQPEAVAWSEKQIETMKAIYGEVIRDGYAGPRGFDSLEAWARAFGITPAPAACPGPDCCNAGSALRFMFVPNAVNKAGWYDYPGLARIPAIQTGCTMADCPGKDVAFHELAHLWDFRGNGALSTALDRAMGVARTAERRVDVEYYYGRKASEAYLPAGKPPFVLHGDFPSAYFDSANPTQPAGGEHFAETVAAYFLIERGDRYYYPVCWTDEDPRCLVGAKYEYDRYDFMRELFESAAASDKAAG